ncbi:MAG: VanZ family protein [Bacilli bacterium]
MLTPLEDAIRSVIFLSWPMVVVCSLTLVAIRIVYLLKNKEPLVLYKELFTLGFLIYILCLFQIVTFQDLPSMGGSNFIPFREILRYSVGSRLFFKQVIGNLLLFVPYGFFVSYYIKPLKPWVVMFLGLISSLSIEITQALIGRIFDIDDLILNVMGCLIGFLLYYIARKTYTLIPKFLTTKWILNIISLVLLGVFMWYICGVVL